MADQINQELGFDVANALSNLQALGNAISNVSGRITRFGNTLQKFNAQVGAIPGGFGAAGNAAVGFGNQIQTINGNVQRLTTSMQLLSRIVFTQLVIKGLRIAEQSLLDATKRAAEFQVKLADIRTISDGTFGSIEQIGSAVEKLSIQLGTDQLEVARGLYEALGNQIGGTQAELLDFERVVGQFSVATLTDFQESNALLSTILNGLQIDISRTEEVASKLNKTIDLGAITGQQLASELGRGIPQAQLLGVSLEEVLASMATLTRNGLSAAESMTRLIGVMTGLQKPSEQLKTIFRNLGVDTGEQLVGALGLAGALDAVTQEARRLNVPLAQVFTNIRGLAGAAILGSQQLDEFQGDLDKIQGTARSLNQERFNIVFETDAKRVERELNELRVEMTRLGTELLHATAQAFDFVGGARSIIDALKLATPIIAAYTARTLASVAATRAQTAASKSAALAVGQLASALLAASIAAEAGSAIGTFITNREFEAFDRLRASNQARVAEFEESEKSRVEASRRATDEIVRFALDASREQIAAYNQVVSNATVDEKKLVRSVQGSLDQIIGLRQRMVNELRQAATDATRQIEQSQERLNNLRLTRDERDFERRFAGADPEQEFSFRLSRATDLARQASQQLSTAVNDTQISQALRTFQQAERSGEAARSIAERLGDRRLENFAVERLNSLTDTQITAEERLQKIQEDKAESAREAANSQQSVINSLKAQAKVLVENIPTVGLDPKETAERQARRQAALSEIVKQGFSQSDLSVADALGLTKLAAEINTELQRDPIRLNLEIEGGIDQLSRRVQEAFQRLRVEIPIDVEGLESLFGRELTSADQITSALGDARKEAEQLRDELSKASTERQRALQGMKSEVDEIIRLTGNTNLQRFQGARPLPGFEGTLLDFGGLDPEQLQRSQQIVNSIVTQIQSLSSSGDVNKNDITGLDSQIRSLRTIRDAAGLTDNSGFNRIINGLETAATRLQLVADATGGSPEQEARLKQLESVIQSSGLASDRILSAGESFGDQVRTSADYFVDRVAPLVNSGGGPSANLASGGMARGSDTVPAMLTPGEVVMNRNASQRWFSDLQRMNAGMEPQFRQNGGPVTSIGDIHITVQESKSPQATADQVWQQIQRRARMGTISK